MRSRTVRWGFALVCTAVVAVAAAGFRPGLAYTPGGGRSAAGHDVLQTPVTLDASTSVSELMATSRPVGSLVMTVNCGVFGALPAFDGEASGWPGFSRPLGAERAQRVVEEGFSGDGCVSALQSAEVISQSGHTPSVSAWGRLNQISVLDTRDDDSGWTLTGSVSEVVGADGHRWSGNYVGWIPYVTHDSARIPTGPNTSYDQVVRPGAAVLPGTGVLSGDGLGSGPSNTLASAAAGAGLGEATIDGRLLLLLPGAEQAQSGYTTVITLTLM